jgi:hypothetical protein
VWGVVEVCREFRGGKLEGKGPTRKFERRGKIILEADLQESEWEGVE